jgi:aspartyl-tRNA(Asn)/glutamyl-tRNA(Gln) amidotransferase subunit A
MTLASLTQQRKLIQTKQASPAELAGECYRRIEKLNPKLNAFITVMPREEISAPEDAPLYGIPIAVKDLYATKGVLTTGGSKFFAENIPDEDAVVVSKMKDAGAQIVGKTNTHEIALGVTNNNPHYGACRNPWDVTRVSGGSSGGSAVAVATGMVTAALGTDTGGSIRIPASLCGVVGFKPTYGRSSLRGVLPLSWNLDHAGPLTRTVEDAAVMLQVMSGYDEIDPGSINAPIDDYLAHLKDSIKGIRVAFAVGNFVEEVTDPDVAQAIREAARILKEQGAVITEVNADFLREAALANALMTQSDGAAFHRERLKEHPDWFGADIRLRLETGAGFTSSEYILARRTQTEMKRKCEIFFQNYDALLLPSTPIPAPVLEGENAIERARMLTRFTAPFNLTGLPALSVPCGFTQDKLPIGLQIVTRAWNEAGALRIGHAFEQATTWHTAIPIA